MFFAISLMSVDHLLHTIKCELRPYMKKKIITQQYFKQIQYFLTHKILVLGIVFFNVLLINVQKTLNFFFSNLYRNFTK